MITVERLHKELGRIIREYPNGKDFPLIFSIDDEGNGYRKIHQLAVEAQVHNLKEYDLELVGFYSGDESIDKENVNCVIIN